MSVMDLLRKNKNKIAAGAILGSVFVGYKAAEKIDEIRDANTKIEQRTENKSQIHQKIAYFDEYVTAVENGKDKEKAYREFALKMADGDAQKMAEMQKQLDKMAQKQKNTEGLLLLCLAMGGYLILKNDFNFEFNVSSKLRPSSKHHKSDEPYKRSEIGFHTR